MTKMTAVKGRGPHLDEGAGRKLRPRSGPRVELPKVRHAPRCPAASEHVELAVMGHHLVVAARAGGLVRRLDLAPGAVWQGYSVAIHGLLSLA